MIVFLFLVYLVFQATAVIAWSFVSAEHMRIARRVWMDNWCFYLLYLSNSLLKSVFLTHSCIYDLNIIFRSCVYQYSVCRGIYFTFHGDAADNEPSEGEKKASVQIPAH